MSNFLVSKVLAAKITDVAGNGVRQSAGVRMVHSRVINACLANSVNKAFIVITSPIGKVKILSS